MLSPPTTPSSRRLMTSKIQLLGDGAGDVYLHCHFPQLSLPRPSSPWALETLPWSSTLRTTTPT